MVRAAALKWVCVDPVAGSAGGARVCGARGVAAHRRRRFSGAERTHRLGGLPGHGHVDPFAQHLMQQGIQNRRDAAHGVSSSRWNAESMEVASWGP